MKNKIMKLLSALLMLCMISGAFAAFFTGASVVSYAADSDEEEEEVVGFDSDTFLKTRYASAEDKLRTMSVVTDTGMLDKYLDPIYTYAPYKTYKNLELYVQQETGEVAVRNTETGQVIFTNPYDAAPLGIDENGRSVTDPRPNAKSKLPEMSSQLIITYENITDAKQATFNTFTDAAANNQVRIIPIKNGVLVEYTMGTIEERRLVPMYIEKYRFETLILKNIRENDPKAYNKMLTYYTRWYMNGENGTVNDDFRKSVDEKYPAMAKYGPEEDRELGIFVSQDYDELKEAEYQALRDEDDVERKAFESKKRDSSVDPPYYIPYFGIPYSGYMSFYTYGVVNAKPSPRELTLIEGWIRAYDPTYTFDDLEYDHELTGYKKQNVAVPSFQMALEYTLTDEGFEVRLPANSILFDEDNFRLLNVVVLPYLGAGSDENEGYIFVPDGSGSLIRFEDYVGTSVIFSTGTMFGPDSAYHALPASYTGHEEIMRLPVYGISETVERTFTKTDEGEYVEDCSHRWVEKDIKPDCTRKVNGGKIVYCAACGESHSEFRPYEHDFISKKYIQEQDCRHEGIYTAECRTCRDFYNSMILRGFTADQLKAEYGDLLSYTINEGYGDHKYSTYYVDIDGVCCAYDVCITEYELRDDAGNIVYQTDEEGNIVYEVNDKGKYVLKNGEKIPVPVMVQCGAVRTDAKTGEVVYTPAEHDYEEEETVSYVKDGHCYIERTCWKCGHHEILVDEHVYDGEGVKVSIDGKCMIKNICLYCGEEVLTETEHTYSEDYVYTPAGQLCVETRTCLYCGHTEDNYFTHVAETIGEPVYDTVNHRCYVESVCQNCKGTYKEELEHEFDDSGVCRNCGFAIPKAEGHTYSVGYVEVGGECFRTFFDEEGNEYAAGAERVKVEHKYGEKIVKDFACSEEIRSYYVCEHCGSVAGEVVKQNLNVVPHSFVWQHDEGVDCIAGYDERQICEVCGLENGTRHVVGHVYAEPKELVTGLTEEVCKVCGHVHYTQYAVEPEEPGVEAPAAGEGEEAEEPAEEPAEDENKVTVTEKRGFMAIMTEGSALASLTAVTGGAESKYCRAYMSVTPRPKDTYNLRDAISSGADAEWTVVSKRKYTGNYTLNVTMLHTMNSSDQSLLGVKNSVSEATYAGMANVYRRYLQSTGMLAESPIVKNGTLPLYLEAFGTISVASTFLTIPITEKKALNTFEGLKSVIEDLESEGIATSDINLKLEGFTNNGMVETMPYKVDFESEVGGDDGYEDFLSYTSDKGVGVYPDFDFVYSHTDKAFDGYSDSDHAVKTIDGRYIVKKEYDATLQIFTQTGLLAVSSSVFDYFYKTFTENYGKFNNSGIAVSTLGTDLNSDFDKDDPYNREDSADFTKELLSNLKNDFGSVLVNGGNEYALGYADHILNMSLTGSTYLRTSCSVPFMAMVLHGYKNYAGSATNMASSIDQEILHIIENGASPYFIIATDNTKYLKETNNLSKYYSLEYSTWKSDLIDVYKELYDILNDVSGSEFIDHSFVPGTRVPDADEVENDMRTIIETVRTAITKYKTAKLRIDNAKAIYARKFATPLAEAENGIKEILAKYSWNTEDPTLEDISIVVSEEDSVLIAELLEKVGHLKAVMSVKARKPNITVEEELHIALFNDIAKAQAVYDAAKEEFELVMSRNEFFFDVAPEDRLDAEAYNEESYLGIYSVVDGKIKVITDGVTDITGKPVTSIYSLDNNSIVRVAYANGVEIYLNYNYYDVIVDVNGENVRIPAYDLYKTKKGAN